MNWIAIGKALSTFVVYAGVSSIVKNVVIATTPKDISTFNKLLIGFGGFALSGMIADQTCSYVSKEIDELLSLRGEKELEVVSPK